MNEERKKRLEDIRRQFVSDEELAHENAKAKRQFRNVIIYILLGGAILWGIAKCGDEPNAKDYMENMTIEEWDQAIRDYQKRHP